ncbi:hypothetical protein O53_1765 [Microcystis aeruginosa TAIHU98]|uniref:Uncharacterized protein n=1 Tax=Microcystis aeruginosa TAIHU98 TaxID=1134457 RepID=L7EEN4_MICAE|nr:hypothetical protein O53_1765 [Microcystis aeruginosa TAIHU98]
MTVSFLEETRPEEITHFIYYFYGFDNSSLSYHPEKCCRYNLKRAK